MYDDDIDLMDYLRATAKHWFLALLTIVIVMGLVIIYLQVSTPVYEAKSFISVSNQDQANFLLGSAAPKLADLETQKLIIQSPYILYPVYATYGERTFTMTVSSVKNANVIELTIQAYTPENAAIIANDITQRYINYTTESRTSEARNNIAFIDEKIASYDEEMNLLDLEITYYENNNVTQMTRQDRLRYQALIREMTAKTKLYDYLLTKREEAALTANMDSANIRVIVYPEVPKEPLRPNKQLILALGAIIALGAAVGVASLAESMAQDKKKRRVFR